MAINCYIFTNITVIFIINVIIIIIINITL